MTRVRPASARAWAFCGSSEPLVVRVEVDVERSEHLDEPLEVAPESGSPPVMPELLDAVRDECPREPLDLLVVEQLRPGQELVVAAEDLLRHAVDAAEVAAVRDRDPQVPQGPAEPVHRPSVAWASCRQRA